MNYLEGLEDLVKGWDAILDENVPEFTQPHAVENRCGLEANHFPSITPVQIATRRHPQFDEFIESGVRSLVRSLIDRLNCITYSSCEGHCVQGVLDSKFSFRHVGILPRSRDEWARFQLVLTTVASAVNAASSNGVVRVVIERREITTNGPSRQCIDLIFAAETGSSQEYFGTVDSITRMFIEVLEYATRADLHSVSA